MHRNTCTSWSEPWIEDRDEGTGRHRKTSLGERLSVCDPSLESTLMFVPWDPSLGSALWILY